MYVNHNVVEMVWEDGEFQFGSCCRFHGRKEEFHTGGTRDAMGGRRQGAER
jgi:hypothetical protein